MELNFLPAKVLYALKNYNINCIYEIRLREGYPIKINYLGDKKLLLDDGGNVLVCKKVDIDYIIDSITECSLYAFSERIKDGYLTAKNGVRVGLAGECVCEDGVVLTIKNIKSLNIRIPHTVFGASDCIYEKLFKDKMYNTLIVAPPFSGKTTILKDLVRRINAETSLDVLIIDERGEFSCVVGENIDVISYAEKQASFLRGVRTLSPDVVIMDELGGVSDFSCVEYALSCGVKLIATVHGDNVKDLALKPYYKQGLFDRYVFLNGGIKKGVVNKILDAEFNEV